MKLHRLDLRKRKVWFQNFKDDYWQSISQKKGWTMIIALSLIIVIVVLLVRSKNTHLTQESLDFEGFVKQKSLEVDTVLGSKASSAVIEKLASTLVQERDDFYIKNPKANRAEMSLVIDRLLKKLEKKAELKSTSFFDTNILETGLETKLLYTQFDQLYVLSTNKDKVFRLDIKSKSSKSFRFAELINTVSFFTLVGQTSAVTKNGQILTLSGKGFVSKDLPVSNADIRAASVWKNNLYFLDSTLGLFKSPLEPGATSEAYFSDSALQSASNNKSGLVVNGFLYLYDDYSLEKYQSGNRVGIESGFLNKDEKINHVTALADGEILVITSHQNALRLDSNFYVLAKYQNALFEGAIFSNFNSKANGFFIAQKNKIYFLEL